jgi:hypothetical protein
MAWSTITTHKFPLTTMFDNENNSEFASDIEIIIVSKNTFNLEVLL